MAIPYKVIAKKNPSDPESTPKYYPRLVTMGQTASLETIAYDMKEASSLSVGDIKSVLSNFVVMMRRALYNGHSVNIAGFGVFSLTAHAIGSNLKADCSVKNFKSIKINFRASTSVRPDLASKKVGEVMTFVDVEKVTEEKKESTPKA